MILNRTQQEGIRELLKLLGQTQKEMADKIGYAPSALSEALRYSEPKSINDEKWQEIVDFFASGAEASQGDLSRRGLLTRAEQLLQELRSGSAGPTIHPPGGQLPANAKNYVQRQCDRVLMGSRGSNIAEHPGSYPAILIRGGIQSGRSSLLQRCAWAVQRMGSDVRWLDFKNVVAEAPGSGSSPVQLLNQAFRSVFRELDIDRTPLPKGEASESEWRTWGRGFIDFAAGLAHHTFFFLDSIDLLLRIDPTGATFNDFIRFLGWIRDRRPDHVSIVSVYSAAGWGVIHGSPYANASYEVSTASLSLDEVAQLLNLLFTPEKLADVDAKARLLINAFGGQPHLTHVAAFALKNHPSPNSSGALHEVLHEAGLRFDEGGEVEPESSSAATILGPYKTHWDRMRRELLELLRETETADERRESGPEISQSREVRLAELFKALSDPTPQLSVATRGDFAHMFDRFVALGFAYGAYPGRLTPFYRTAISRDPYYRERYHA